MRIESFGFSYGAPPADADWVADVRDIDSDVYDGLEDRTGLDEELRLRVLETSTAQAWIRKFELDVLPDLEADDVVAVGCSHGARRSVSVAIALAESAATAGYEVELVHRDIDRAQDDDDDRDTAASMEAMSNVTPIAAGRAWYEIKNAAADVAEIFIYEQIGEDWWTGEGITSKTFISDLGQIKAGQIDLHVNSPGGSVFDGLAIANALQRHPAKVTTYVDGLAASIASIIALAGDRVVMAANSLFMIHNPAGGVSGTADDMRKMADVLDKIRDTLVNTYEARTGLDRDDLIAALDAETWYTAEEALAAGFADEVAEPIRVAASFDLSKFPFRHAPTAAAGECYPCTCDHTDSDPAGAAEAGTSGGAPEPTTASAYVPGVGFINL